MGDEIKLGAYAVTEPSAGSDVRSLRTTAKLDGDEWVLNGTKVFITNGGIADVTVVVATVDPDLGHRGQASFVVPKDTPGLSQGKKESKLGIRASQTAEVVLEDCRVPMENLLGGYDKLQKKLERARSGQSTGRSSNALATFELTRPLVGASALGIAQAAYEWTLEYLEDKEEDGQPLLKQQRVQQVLADVATEIEAARLLVWRASWMGRNGMPMTGGQGSMSKLKAGDVAMWSTTTLMDLVGPFAQTMDCPLEKWFRDAKIYQIFEGTAQVQRLVISRMQADRAPPPPRGGAVAEQSGTRRTGAEVVAFAEGGLGRHLSRSRSPPPHSHQGRVPTGRRTPPRWQRHDWYAVRRGPAGPGPPPPTHARRGASAADLAAPRSPRTRALQRRGVCCAQQQVRPFRWPAVVAAYAALYFRRAPSPRRSRARRVFFAGSLVWWPVCRPSRRRPCALNAALIGGSSPPSRIAPRLRAFILLHAFLPLRERGPTGTPFPRPAPRGRLVMAGASLPGRLPTGIRLLLCGTRARPALPPRAVRRRLPRGAVCRGGRRPRLLRARRGISGMPQRWRPGRTTRRYRPPKHGSRRSH